MRRMRARLLPSLTVLIAALAAPHLGAEPAAAPGGEPPPSAATPAVAHGAALAEKLAAGDRALSGGDTRGALFAYLDASYLDPSSAVARVKLGRAYLALRYPARAQAQAEQALSLDPSSAEATRLLEDARAASAHVAAAAVSTGSGGTPAAAPVAAAPAPVVPATQPRVYKLTPEAQPAARSAPVAVALAPRPDAVPEPPPLPGPTAAQRYRAALDLIARREYGRAVAELDDAIAKDPRLGVAFSARASARFGLARYRDAASDYAMALELDPGLGTPLYGLAECYRLLGDPRAAELYRRYAGSRATDVREELRTVAARRAVELSGR